MDVGQHRHPVMALQAVHLRLQPPAGHHHLNSLHIAQLPGDLQIVGNQHDVVEGGHQPRQPQVGGTGIEDDTVSRADQMDGPAGDRFLGGLVLFVFPTMGKFPPGILPQNRPSAGPENFSFRLQHIQIPTDGHRGDAESLGQLIDLGGAFPLDLLQNESSSLGGQHGFVSLLQGMRGIPGSSKQE